MTLQNESPGGDDAEASEGRSHCQWNETHLAPRNLLLKVQCVSDGLEITLHGRPAQTLRLLIKRGAKGITSGEAAPLGWARRTSSYIHKLRQSGLKIKTTSEVATDGSRVGRYRLITTLVVLASLGCD
jgi:hypothetical protein